MNAKLLRTLLVPIAVLACGSTVSNVNHLQADWTNSISLLFRKKPNEDVWRIQGSEYVDSAGKRLRYVTVLTTPRQTALRGCKSQAISLTLQPGEYLDGLLVCEKHPCRQELWTYAAVLGVGETAKCSEIDVGRYFLLATPIEELALVELYDLADCMRRNGAKVMDEKVCGVRFVERTERTESIRREQGKRYRELLELVKTLRLRQVKVVAQPPRPAPMAYELGFALSGGFSCDRCINISIVFKTRDEAEIEVYQTTS